MRRSAPRWPVVMPASSSRQTKTPTSYAGGRILVFRDPASPQDAQARQVLAIVDVGQGTFVLTCHGFPRSVRIQGNYLVTHAHLREGGDNALVTLTNASVVSFCDNEITSFAGGVLPIAVKFDTTRVRKRPLFGWEVVGNRFRGDARLPSEFDDPGLGSFDVGVSMAVSGPSNTDMRVSGNTFYGCATGVRIRTSSSGDLTAIPTVTGNTGAGVAVELQGVNAVLVDGNQQQPGGGLSAPAGARYAGTGEPGFAAPIGSLFSRSDAPLALVCMSTPTGAAPAGRPWCESDRLESENTPERPCNLRARRSNLVTTKLSQARQAAWANPALDGRGWCRLDRDRQRCDHHRHRARAAHCAGR